MKEKYLRFKYYFFVRLKKMLSRYKFCLPIMFSIFLIGLITGIMTCSGYSSDLTCENLINKYLFDFLTRECNFFTLFLILAVFFLILSIATILLVKSKILVVITNILLFFLAYMFGFDLFIIIVCLGLAGIVLGILTYLFFGIIMFISYILILSVISRRLWDKSICDNNTSKDDLKLMILFIVIGIIALFCLSFFFSLIHIFVIVE